MILQLNHLHGKSAPTTAQDVVAALYALVEEGSIDAKQFAYLQVQLDWLQYKQNFRQMVSVTKPLCADKRGGRPSILDLRIDTRQIVADQLKGEIIDAIQGIHTAESEGAIILEDFKSFRQSIAWQFNHAYWNRLKDWEVATGKGYEQALPGGSSDGNNGDAIHDSVEEFYTLLKDMDGRKQLPPEIHMMEIGVGNGSRCGRFVTRFRDVDQERGTGYYSRLRVILGDFSDDTLAMTRPAMADHLDKCSFVPLDALNPIKTLARFRHKLLYVHSTNMYDNLPDEELVRRDDKLYFVHQRAFLPGRDARKLALDFDLAVDDLRPAIDRLLEGRQDFLGDKDRGMRFWMQLWPAIKLEERLASMEDLRDDPFPAGLDYSKTEDMLQGTAANLRIHLSSGALESLPIPCPCSIRAGIFRCRISSSKNSMNTARAFSDPANWTALW